LSLIRYNLHIHHKVIVPQWEALLSAIPAYLTLFYVSIAAPIFTGRGVSGGVRQKLPRLLRQTYIIGGIE